MRETSGERQGRFCQVYLQTMDPERAAAAAGYRDGYAKLAAEPVQRRLDSKLWLNCNPEGRHWLCRR